MEESLKNHDTKWKNPDINGHLLHVPLTRIVQDSQIRQLEGRSVLPVVKEMGKERDR